MKKILSALTLTEIKTYAKKLFLVVFGTLVLAFGCAVFVIPFELVTGGVTGISILIDHALGGLIPISVIIAVITWVLFFVGLFVLGRDFALKTLVSTILYPVGIGIFSLLVSPDVLDGFFYLQGSAHGQISLLLGALMGGLGVGVGCALTFLGGGSTGGIDIIAFVICKYWRRAKSSVMIFILDAATVIFGMFIIGDLVITLLGVISAFVGALVIDRIFVGGNSSFIAQIISDKHDEIREQILRDLNRGATIVDVVGAYSGESRKMVMVSFTMRQYNQVLDIINRTDKRAFVTIHRAHQINGEGWTWNEQHNIDMPVE